MFHRLPPLNSLRMFEAAARHGSFKAAGAELNVTPTAVSHQIARLEAQLGVLLFERKVRAVSLTAEGQQLAQVAHQALQQLADTLEVISASGSVLRIATTSAFAAMWLVPRLDRFRQRHPEIEVQLHTSEAAVDLRRDRRIDLAIRYGHCPPRDAVRLLDEQFEAVATPALLASGVTLSEADLIATRWQNPTLAAVGWDDWLQAYAPGTASGARLYFDQEQHVVQAALAGQGMALLSSVMAEMPIRQGWLTPIRQGCALAGFSYYLLTSPFSARQRKVTLFRAWLEEMLDVRAGQGRAE